MAEVNGGRILVYPGNGMGKNEFKKITRNGAGPSEQDRVNFFALKQMNYNPGLSYKDAKKNVEQYGYGDYK